VAQLFGPPCTRIRPDQTKSADLSETRTNPTDFVGDQSLVEFGFIWVSSVQVGLRSELSMGWVEPWVGLGWVGLGQSADGLGWIGSHEMDPWTTLLETQKVECDVTDCS